MGGDKDFLAEQPVVNHEQRAVEELKFVVPQNVKDIRLGDRSVADKSRVVL